MGLSESKFLRFFRANLQKFMRHWRVFWAGKHSVLKPGLFLF